MQRSQLELLERADDELELDVIEIVSMTPGGYTSISLTGMLVREQISTTQKNRMTLNSNRKKIECPKIQTPKNKMNQDAMFVKV